MDKKELTAILTKIVQSEVNRQVSMLKMQIMSEVAGMLQYTERKVLQEIESSRKPVRESSTRQSDYDRVVGNLSTMPGFRDRLPQSKTVRQRPVGSQKRYATDPMLNQILNETSVYSPDEVRSAQSSITSMFSFGDTETQYEEPWEVAPPELDEEPAVEVPQLMRPVRTDSVPVNLSGTDGKPIDLRNETVKKVIDVISTTNYADKLKRMTEAGDRFRGMNPVAPKFTAEYFDKTTVG